MGVGSSSSTAVFRTSGITPPPAVLPSASTEPAAASACPPGNHSTLVSVHNMCYNLRLPFHVAGPQVQQRYSRQRTHWDLAAMSCWVSDGLSKPDRQEDKRRDEGGNISALICSQRSGSGFDIVHKTTIRCDAVRRLFSANVQRVAACATVSAADAAAAAHGLLRAASASAAPSGPLRRKPPDGATRLTLPVALHSGEHLRATSSCESTHGCNLRAWLPSRTGTLCCTVAALHCLETLKGRHSYCGF